MSDVDRANERARSAARKTGHAIYQHQVVDAWPGCVDCGLPIRPRPFDSRRKCGCPGRLWRSDYGHGGWVIEPAALAGAVPAPTDTEEPGER